MRIELKKTSLKQIISTYGHIVVDQAYLLLPPFSVLSEAATNLKEIAHRCETWFVRELYLSCGWMRMTGGNAFPCMCIQTVLGPCGALPASWQFGYRYAIIGAGVNFKPETI